MPKPGGTSVGKWFMHNDMLPLGKIQHDERKAARVLDITANSARPKHPRFARSAAAAFIAKQTRALSDFTLLY